MTPVVQLDVLSVFNGHEKDVVQIDDEPAKRDALSKKVLALVRDGFQVFLSDGSRVRGYDAATNEWLVAAGPKSKEMMRVPAAGSPATAIAPSSGG